MDVRRVVVELNGTSFRQSASNCTGPGCSSFVVKKEKEEEKGPDWQDSLVGKGACCQA